MKRKLVLDFDGVLHSYSSGWHGADVVLDPPVDGAMKFILDAASPFEIYILSARSCQEGGIEAMKQWLLVNLIKCCKIRFITNARGRAEDILRQIHFPTSKPEGTFLTIDDRCICFDGSFPSIEDIQSFKPWNRKGDPT